MPSTSVGLCSFLLASLLCASPALAKRNEHRPVYSPDGSEVIFMSMSDKTNGDWELYRMNSDGSNVIRLTSHQGWDGYAVWSPKGEEIVFDRVDGHEAFSGIRNQFDKKALADDSGNKTFENIAEKLAHELQDQNLFGGPLGFLCALLALRTVDAP